MRRSCGPASTEGGLSDGAIQKWFLSWLLVLVLSSGIVERVEGRYGVSGTRNAVREKDADSIKPDEVVLWTRHVASADY